MIHSCYEIYSSGIFPNYDPFFRSQTSDGSLPIHLACQYSSDPTLLVNLLYYDKSVVNFERTDGFTPLHLVAARADMQDVPLGLIRLDEDTQVKTLFEMNVTNYVWHYKNESEELETLIWIYALSFYRSKMILDRPNCFGWIQIVLVGSKSFWSGLNHFGQVQIIKISQETSNLSLTKMIWT